MKRKVIAVFFVFVFIISGVNVSAISNPEEENVEIITPVSVMEREPYYENQKITVVFSIKNRGKNPIYIDSITAAVVNEEDEYSNSQWFRSVVINPDKSYHFKGDITFDKAGKYSIFICYKEQSGRWVKFDDPSLALEMEINKRDDKNGEARVLPNAYKGIQYGPVNVFLNDDYKKVNSDDIHLPKGLKFSNDGCITGIPAKSGEFTFEIDLKNGFKETYKLTVEENADSLLNRDVIKKEEFSFQDTRARMFSDVQSHWAKDTIMSMCSLDIIKGFPDGSFCPDNPVTRAELSAIVFNAFNFSPSKQNEKENENGFTDIEKHWAREFISEVSGHFTFIDDGVFNPDKPANREETIAVIASAAGLNNSYVNPSVVDCVFKDSKSISDSLKELIAQCYLKGIVRGYEDGTFGPCANVTRAEVCTIIENVLVTGVSTDILSSRPFDNQDLQMEDEHSFQEFLADNYSDENNLIPATRGSSGIDKRKLRQLRLEYIFGKNADGTYNLYKSKEEADANMKEIDIKVWDFDTKTGEKVTKILKLTVNKKISDEVAEIFNLIYEHDEKFPIKSVVGYTWRAPYGANNRISEHNYGTAIDINWAENPQVINGAAVTQGSWQPGVNPYSIPAEGSVVKIFKSYQWAWGGDAWGSHNRDYMHFSFLGN